MSNESFEQAPYPHGTPQTPGLAVAGLVLGILGIVGCGITAPFGVVCSAMALSRIKKSNGELGGQGLAIAGLITSIVGLLLLLVMVLYFVIFGMFVYQGIQANKQGFGVVTQKDPTILLNESQAQAALYTLAAAQKKFYAQDRDGDGVLEYAQHLTGAQSLYELRNGAGDLQLIETALADAHGSNGTLPYHGYRFVVLKGQNKNVPGGARSYLEGENLTGYVLLAYPEEYGISGVDCFALNSDGLLLNANLGAIESSLLMLHEELAPEDITKWKRIPGNATEDN